MPFTEEECSYLQGHAIGRLATVSADGEPDISPVSYRIHEGHVCIGGLDTLRSIKYRNVRATGKVAFVVDDSDADDRRGPRGLKVHGHADVISGPGGAPEIRIHPDDVWSWGLNRIDEPFEDDETYVQEMSIIEDVGCHPV
ncbi:MAG: PPOX class F420-dependent oxidoreductase [Acidimicrobiia bacterium]|nr:PPOX class F420-dependent oxidoreductase [Acidimicrobiia bacterium]